MKRILKILFILGLIASVLAGVTAFFIGSYYYHRLTRDLPKIERLSDYEPEAVSAIYAEDGTLVAEISKDGMRRYPVEFSEIPQLVKNAFLAAEDENFYHHKGIDLISILRAVWVNLRHKDHKQGASTITQQVVKSLLLSREKTYERKAKEAILSYKLEQHLTKDEIFSIYLNEIYLGATAYGVKAAAQVYFHKELKDLTIGEAAFIAGLPPKPSYYADKKHRSDALNRRKYVLRQLFANKFISKEEHEQALAEELIIFPPDDNRIFHAPYYVSHVLRLSEEKFGTRMQSPGGFRIETALDLKAYQLAEAAVKRGVEESDKRRGFRGPIKHYEAAEVETTLEKLAKQFTTETDLQKLVPRKIYRALVSSIDKKSGAIVVSLGDREGEVFAKENNWAKKLINAADNSRGIELPSFLRPGDLIEVSLFEPKQEAKQTGEIDPESGAQLTTEEAVAAEEIKQQLTASGKIHLILNQTPELDGAFSLINALTGEVKVIIGGYDYKRNQFNLATQGLRQPGSSFKPFVYYTAVDRLNYTPSTIVPDSPISLVAGNGQIWSPGNFDGEFLGPITLRTALQKSRNVVSVYLIRRTGLQPVIENAHKMGITTPINEDLSVSLGTAEVHPIEMTQAYGVFASGGYLADQLVIKRILDRHGNVFYEQKPKQEKVINEDSAFIMAHMMKGVIDRGTATILKQLNRPIAGKTGTTNEHMDTWFIGYTPEWTAGVWVGFAGQKRTVGRMETGGKTAAPIFLYFMQDFLKDTPALDFQPPDGVIPIAVNVSSGQQVDPSSAEAFIEYFKAGTEPGMGDYQAEIPQDYLTNQDF
ncbi:PBP1A family penicillin-binding protein [bacterium]|nr:PBP1A family penicillin-binding protein [bacterium]